MALGIALSVFMAGALLAGGEEVARTQETVSVRKGFALVGNVKIPVYKDVDSVTVDTYGKKIIVSYSIMEGATDAQLIKFYKGKRIFGQVVGAIKEDKYGHPFFEKCNKKTGMGIHVTVDSTAGPMMISVSNHCDLGDEWPAVPSGGM